MKVINSLSKSRWEEFVRVYEHNYLFHTPAWAKILEETFGYQIATKLYEIAGNKILVPMMKRRKYGFSLYDSMPLGYGGIFSSSELSSNQLQEMFEYLVGGGNLFFILTLPPFCNLPIQNNSHIKEVDLKEGNYTHILLLEREFEYLWKNKFKQENRTAIRKAEKNNIDVLNENSLQNFREYYEIYAESSKRWGYKKPPYPLKFFENLCKFGNSHVQLRLAIKDEEIIAGLINFYYDKNVFYWGSAFLERFGKYRPANLLLKDSIEYACNEGYKYYNFGGSGSLMGVRKFKESFGAEKAYIKRYIVSSQLGKLANMILKRY